LIQCTTKPSFMKFDQMLGVVISVLRLDYTRSMEIKARVFNQTLWKLLRSYIESIFRVEWNSVIARNDNRCKIYSEFSKIFQGNRRQLIAHQFRIPMPSKHTPNTNSIHIAARRKIIDWLHNYHSSVADFFLSHFWLDVFEAFTILDSRFIL